MNSQKSLQWHIQQNDESLMVQLSGDLIRDTLLPLWKQRASFLSPKAEQHIYWDLQGLGQIDSAGFILLVDMLNHYQVSHKNCLINPPELVKTLADLYELDEWLMQFLICEHKQRCN